jgi:hypothetical protein
MFPMMYSYVKNYRVYSRKHSGCFSSPGCHANPSEEKPKLLRAEGNKTWGKEKLHLFLFKVVDSWPHSYNPNEYCI